MKKITLLKSMLLLCALVAGSSSVWAAPGDEIKSPTNVVSGKWYYLKGEYTYKSTGYTIYYKISTSEDKDKGKSSGDMPGAISEATPILFTEVAGGWTMRSPNGYYIRPHTSNGQAYLQSGEYTLTLESVATKEGSGKGIKINEYVDGDEHWCIQAAKTSARIGGYKSEQWGVTLIEAYAPATFAAGKTMISFSDANHALDCANLPSGLKAYMVSAANASSVTLTEVTEAVAKNTGLILTGNAGETYNIPVVGSGTDISGTNKLVATDGTSNVSDAAVLSGGEFHPLTSSGVIAAGKAYLPYANITGGNPFGSGAHALEIVFGNETTAIKAVEAKKVENGVFYNLAGQQVAQPSKGLYIVNGKKVIIK